MIWYGTLRYCMVRYGMVRYGKRVMVRYSVCDVVWCGMVRGRCRVLAGKPKLSPFLVNWENVVIIYSIFFII